MLACQVNVPCVIANNACYVIKIDSPMSHCFLQSGLQIVSCMAFVKRDTLQNSGVVLKSGRNRAHCETQVSKSKALIMHSSYCSHKPTHAFLLKSIGLLCNHTKVGARRKTKASYVISDRRVLLYPE